MTTTWQKSSYCGEGEACIHAASASTAPLVLLTESGDPAGTVLTTAPAAFRNLLHVLAKGSPHD